MVKFVVAVPSGFLTLNLPFIPFVLFTTSGGISGVFVFAFFSKYIFKCWEFLMKFLQLNINKTKPQKKFTKFSRIYTKVIKKYGLIGLSIITPTIISIPVGTLLALRLYQNKFKVILFLSISVFIWSILISSILYFFD
jgi:hypothetical protein